jgi:hypothetical protein
MERCHQMGKCSRRLKIYCRNPINGIADCCAWPRERPCYRAVEHREPSFQSIESHPIPQAKKQVLLAT